MTVEIDENGQIIISAETNIESFALKEITKKWNKPEDIRSSILIETILSQ